MPLAAPRFDPRANFARLTAARRDRDDLPPLPGSVPAVRPDLSAIRVKQVRLEGWRREIQVGVAIALPRPPSIREPRKVLRAARSPPCVFLRAWLRLPQAFPSPRSRLRRRLPIRRLGDGLSMFHRVSVIRGALSDPLGRAIDRSAFSMMSRKGFMMSIGIGKRQLNSVRRRFQSMFGGNAAAWRPECCRVSRPR